MVMSRGSYRRRVVAYLVPQVVGGVLFSLLVARFTDVIWEIVPASLVAVNLGGALLGWAGGEEWPPVSRRRPRAKGTR